MSAQDAIGGVSQEAQDMQTQFWHKQLNDIGNLAGVSIGEQENFSYQLVIYQNFFFLMSAYR